MFCVNIYGPLDWGMVILQLCCWKFSDKETLNQTLFEWNEIEFYSGGSKRGNIHTPSIARWKVRGRLPICHKW